ncbi:chemotaxis protein MotA [Natronincola peptidivorans]|uniref:Chemotaxis protein MotA n=1 Tax=Natronincola peptidivorans TaxID=426128 RepID=A0A1I0DZ12_9FIRM|nr:MotA/TolQ/ExbB proton channel family protein [Natronincola peptidivorans]SET37693.1 chemotaxis protein MotA [Natronincola peptidivorans]
MKNNFWKKNQKQIIIAVMVLVIGQSLISSISLKVLLNLTAIQIIFAGIFISVLVSFPMTTLSDTTRITKESFQKEIDYAEDIYKIHSLAVKVKKDGLLSLQSDIDVEQDTFLRDGMILLNDYKKPEVIRDILEKDIESRETNLFKAYNVFKMISHIAPSLGLVGTLVGLIGLLSNIHQPYEIMNNMAAALVSTLYGSLIANFIAVPIMVRIKEYIDKNILRYNIITEGLLLVARNDSARNVFDKMNVMLKEEKRLEYPDKRMKERNYKPYEFQL